MWLGKLGVDVLSSTSTGHIAQDSMASSASTTVFVEVASSGCRPKASPKQAGTWSFASAAAIIRLGKLGIDVFSSTINGHIAQDNMGSSTSTAGSPSPVLELQIVAVQSQGAVSSETPSVAKTAER